MSKDGLKTVPADVIVYATGFKVEEFFFPVVVTGMDGIALMDRWAKQKCGAQAYMGGILSFS